VKESGCLTTFGTFRSTPENGIVDRAACSMRLVCKYAHPRTRDPTAYSRRAIQAPLRERSSQLRSCIEQTDRASVHPHYHPDHLLGAAAFSTRRFGPEELAKKPYSPWGPSHDSGIRFKYMELARVSDLSAVNHPHFQSFQI
jgi:hypothetical protein